MVWWQELLVVTVSIAFGILVGFIGLRIAFKIWPDFFSRTRRKFFLNNSPVVNDSLPPDHLSKDPKDIGFDSIQVKNTDTVLSLTQKNEQSTIEQETNHKEDPLLGKKADKMSVEKPTRKVRQKADKDNFPPKLTQKIKKSSVNTPKEAARVIHGTADHKLRQVDNETSRFVSSDKEKSTNRPKVAEEIPYQPLGEPGAGVTKDIEVDGNTVQSSAQSGREKALALIELQTNLKIATTPWDGKPLHFQTEIWDRNIGQFDTIEKEPRRNLGEAYLDMHMANQIVWLYSSFGFISNKLVDQYKFLCTKIAERLTVLIQ